MKQGTNIFKIPELLLDKNGQVYKSIQLSTTTHKKQYQPLQRLVENLRCQLKTNKSKTTQVYIDVNSVCQ